MKLLIEHMKEPIKHAVETISHITRHPAVDTGVISVSFATFFGWLPDVTAAFALLYLLIRIWETETIKGWTKR